MVFVILCLLLTQISKTILKAGVMCKMELQVEFGDVSCTVILRLIC